MVESAALSADAALAHARNDTGHLVAQALPLVPGRRGVKTIAASIFTASTQNFAGNCFAAHLLRVGQGEKIHRRITMAANRGRLIPGLILIALGIAFLLMQYFEFGPGLILLLLGVVFLIPYVLTRSYGLLIPGCILAGLGIGLLFGRAPMRDDITVPIGLGLGFIAIFVVPLIIAGSSHWWPLIPGGVLVLVGIAEGIPQAQVLLEKGWPLILILIGLAILAGQFWRSKSGV